MEAHNQQYVWLGFVALLIVLLFVAVNLWRKYEEGRKRILAQYGGRRNAVLSPEREKEKARAIFEGKELDQALSFMDELQNSRDQMKKDMTPSPRSERQVMVFVIVMLLVGIVYGIYRFTNAS